MRSYLDSKYNPSSWKLLAKLNEGDEWTVIDEQTNNTEWVRNEVRWTDRFDLRVKNQPWQYYRLEITKVGGPQQAGKHWIKQFKLLY